MGCLKKLGCLVVLLVLAVVALLTRDRWMKHLPWRSASDSAAIPDAAWMPLTEAGASRTRAALAKLAAPRGPVFVSLDGGDVASYIFLQLTKQMPVSSDSFVARIDQDRIGMRASMKMSDLGNSVLGVLGSVLRDRERVELWGTLQVIGKGRAEYQVRQVKVRDVALPGAVISRLVKPLVRNPQLSGLGENSLPISIPPYVGDVRIANGKITLYKSIP